MGEDKKKSKVSKITHVSFKKGGAKPSEKKDQEKVDEGKTQNFEQNSAKKETRKSMSLPKFLQGLSKKSKKTSKKPSSSDSKNLSNLSVNPVPDQDEEFQDQKKSLGSIGSLFSQESLKVSGVKRVLKKSMIFLGLSALFFLVTSFLSINLFTANIFLVIFSAVLYSALTVIFFVIVADKSYVAILLALQGLLALTVHSFIGEGFNLITILTTLLTILFVYLAYTEVEKVQLGSRLFSINNVTKEAVRMMTTAVVLILVLGSFNKILSDGSSKFVKDVVLDNTYVVDYYILGEDSIIPEIVMNELADKTYKNFNEEYAGEGTFYNFLEDNYYDGNNEYILTSDEKEEIRSVYDDESQRKEQETSIKVEKARAWAAEDFSGLEYDLTTVLGKKEYIKTFKEYSVSKIDNFVNTEKSTELEIIPREYMIPGLLSIILFIVLILFKIFWNALTALFVLIIWSILKLVGFVRIEVETVEAEVVSI